MNYPLLIVSNWIKCCILRRQSILPMMRQGWRQTLNIHSALHVHKSLVMVDSPSWEYVPHDQCNLLPFRTHVVESMVMMPHYDLLKLRATSSVRHTIKSSPHISWRWAMWSCGYTQLIQGVNPVITLYLVVWFLWWGTWRTLRNPLKQWRINWGLQQILGIIHSMLLSSYTCNNKLTTYAIS